MDESAYNLLSPIDRQTETGKRCRTGVSESPQRLLAVLVAVRKSGALTTSASTWSHWDALRTSWPTLGPRPEDVASCAHTDGLLRRDTRCCSVQTTARAGNTRATLCHCVRVSNANWCHSRSLLATVKLTFCLNN